MLVAAKVSTDLRCMENLLRLAGALHHVAGIDAKNFKLSAGLWQERSFVKGEFFNQQGHVCQYLGFVLNGVFRSYLFDPHNGEEKNVFFFSPDQVVVAYKSFVTQTACSYFTGALTEATILYIHVDDLTKLYARSHQWEHFGRIVAEQAFNIAMGKAESLLFRTAEERYLDMIMQHPRIFDQVPLYQISSYLGIRGPSLSRIRRRLVKK